jgi:3',5'-cyclic AMP phosphodiesterase CpdA
MTQTPATFAAPKGPPVVLLAAGDVGQCGLPGARRTGELIRELSPHAVLALGDLAYRDGSAEEFARCYAPYWGAFREQTFPAPGNHDYRTAGAAGYFGYFGARAGDPARGYYSFDLGAWHIVSLNSNRELDPGSPQLKWLSEDLRTHRQRCVLAYWHHPRYSSGPHGNDPRTQALWEILYRQGASVVLAGHDHVYERLSPMNATGERDDERGLHSFVVGTGGAQLYEQKELHALSEAWNNTAWGVLKLTLEADGYAWEFMPVAGASFQDAGRASCTRR